MQKYNICNIIPSFLYIYISKSFTLHIMKSGIFSFLTKPALVVGLCLSLMPVNAQTGSDFWNHVRFGGGLAAGFGSGYTDVTVAPGAIYQFNEYVALGVGLQGTYVNQKNYFSSFMYGGTVSALFNPFPQLQLSAELEQLRVNLDVDDRLGQWDGYTRDFWNTGLFLGAGYHMNNVTVGVKYNVLFREKDMVYSDAFMPFIRVYF